ncbi:class I SAM-dependent methyltransferase [Flavobacteriaceae bacterium TP-CH-4]|uniref:Class I SAM-dependent methyltransferase n=1 Tax=Pelagihabitans pacificus TaxID=2696054 RepID=A0A967APS4_9FLAO|nr:class I SAM-dependent methyltransferase [Pelagihabitans pacificus]NHF57772.1 class I SAM-dependent methyltransferase [Pelagihabitans pacificus]
MKKALDIFSEQSDAYKKFRPAYPMELYSDILKHVPDTACCWDCGTGNGQVALVLSHYFDEVFATDISEAQLARAERRDTIRYKVERAEHTSFDDNTFDLITVAQALHWFDFQAFNKEVRRVSKNGGLISAWGYGLLKISEPIDKVINHFYRQVVGLYWNSERRHVENSYGSIPFDFREIPVESERAVTVQWGLAHLEGYFNSWSSVQSFKRYNKGKNPVKDLMNNIRPLWGSDEKRKINFPIFMKLGRVLK